MDRAKQRALDNGDVETDDSGGGGDATGAEVEEVAMVSSRCCASFRLTRVSFFAFLVLVRGCCCHFHRCPYSFLCESGCAFMHVLVRMWGGLCASRALAAVRTNTMWHHRPPCILFVS